MASESGNDINLLNLCLDFCQNFKDKSSFNFTVNIGAFNLTVNHGRNHTSDVKTARKKEYVSPSTQRRNNLRLLAFKARKAARGSSPTTYWTPHPLDSDTPVGADSGVGSHVADVTSPTHEEVGTPLPPQKQHHWEGKKIKKKAKFIQIDGNNTEEDSASEGYLWTPEINAPVVLALPPTPYKCYTCGQSYSAFNLLKDHICSNHDSRREFNERVKCKNCGRTFNTYLSMNRHVEEYLICEQIIGQSLNKA